MPISVRIPTENMMAIAINWSLAKCSCPSWSANADESALRSSLASLDTCNSSLHWWFGFWTFLVAFGVALEVVFVVWEYWEELHDLRRCLIHPPKRPTTALFVLGLLGAGLVAAGVSGEFWKESQIATVETCIRKGNDALFLLLSKEAGNAQASATRAEASAKTADKVAGKALNTSKAADDVAGKAEQKAIRGAEQADMATADAAKAQASAVIAGDMATRERIEREQMERSLLPRKLNWLRWFEYRKQLEKYAGTKFFIVTLTDTEPMRLGKAIEDLLKAAQWVKEEPMIRYSEADESMIPDGIWIEANGPVVTVPPKPLTAAMDALRDALANSGISAGRSALNPHLPPRELPPDTLRVVIGLKPDSYFEMKRDQRERNEQRR
jgi:hypothetical protein